MRKLKIHVWICPKCGCQFKRHDQAHSCEIFALELHFKGKEASRNLYQKLLEAIRKEIDTYKVESLKAASTL
jgi:hypothetical protein